MSADIVGFADNTFGNDLIQRARVVFDKQPVADLRPVAVHRQWFAGKCVQNHQGMSFRGVEVVIIGTVADNGGQPVSPLPRADKVVGGGFGGGVGAGRRVWRGFCKQIVCAVQIAIDFIGRNMVETEGFAFSDGICCQ